MTETRTGGRSRRRTARPRPNFYQQALTEAERAALAGAAAAEGLTDEVAMLRLLVRRHLAQQPENFDQTIKALHLLVRMVAVQFRLSGEDAERLDERVAEVVNQFAAVVLTDAGTSPASEVDGSGSNTGIS
jgi:hypothetical protein